MKYRNSNIPEPTKKELVELFGENKAQQIMESNINFRGVSNIIIEEKIVRKFRIRKLQVFVKSKLKISLFSLLFILLAISVLLSIII